MTATATPATSTPTQLKVQRVRLQDGDAGTAQTIALMKRMLADNEGAGNPEVRRKALDLVKDIPSGDKAGERNAIFQWVKSNIKFRGEYQETLQSALVTMQLGAGDCDDHASLMAALLEAIGHETMFKTVGTDGHREYSHVYTVVRDAKSNQWIPVDTTVPTSYPGWESPRITRSKTWGNNLSGGLSGFRGLGAYRRRPLGDAQDVLNSFQPLINAAAIRVAYGNNAGIQPFTQNLGPQTQIGSGSFSSMPNWVPWALGLGVFAVFINGIQGGRR